MTTLKDFEVSHDHPHAPAPEAMNRAFLAGILLNTAFLLVEVVYGLRDHSLSLVADGAHRVRFLTCPSSR